MSFGSQKDAISIFFLPQFHAGSDKFPTWVNVTAITLVATGGVLTMGLDPREPAYTQAELDALVDEAHRLGMTVAAHAIGEGGVAAALRAGVDSVEHGCYLDEDPELIPMMAQHGTFFTPTLLVYEYHSESRAPHVRERARAGAVRRGLRSAYPDQHHAVCDVWALWRWSGEGEAGATAGSPRGSRRRAAR